MFGRSLLTEDGLQKLMIERAHQKNGSSRHKQRLKFGEWQSLRQSDRLSAELMAVSAPVLPHSAKPVPAFQMCNLLKEGSVGCMIVNILLTTAQHSPHTRQAIAVLVASRGSISAPIILNLTPRSWQTSCKGTLGTWWSLRRARARLDKTGQTKP